MSQLLVPTAKEKCEIHQLRVNISAEQYPTQIKSEDLSQFQLNRLYWRVYLSIG